MARALFFFFFFFFISWMHETSARTWCTVARALMDLFYRGTDAIQGFPGGWVVKNPPGNAGVAEVAVLIPGSGRSLGEGNGSLRQYSCLGNPMDGEAWRAAVHGITRFKQDWAQNQEFQSLNHLPKAVPPNTITLGIRFQLVIWWRWNTNIHFCIIVNFLLYF